MAAPSTAAIRSVAPLPPPREVAKTIYQQMQPDLMSAKAFASAARQIEPYPGIAFRLHARNSDLLTHGVTPKPSEAHLVAVASICKSGLAEQVEDCAKRQPAAT